MRTTRRLLSLLLALTLAGHLVLFSAAPAWAQFFDESLEQQQFFPEDEDEFFEDRGGDGFGTPSPEQDFTEGDQYIDEELIPADERGVTARGRRFDLTLGRERETLPLNIAWGAGTGLLIGGWFALIGEGDNRETQRSIGVGIVAGILLGVAVGTRAVFDPDAPRPTVGEAQPGPGDGPQFSPALALQPDDTRVGFRMTF